MAYWWNIMFYCQSKKQFRGDNFMTVVVELCNRIRKQALASGVDQSTWTISSGLRKSDTRWRRRYVEAQNNVRQIQLNTTKLARTMYINVAISKLGQALQTFFTFKIVLTHIQRYFFKKIFGYHYKYFNSCLPKQSREHSLIRQKIRKMEIRYIFIRYESYVNYVCGSTV